MLESRAESLGSGQVVRLDGRLRSCEVFAALDPGALARLSESSGRHRYDRRQIARPGGTESRSWRPSLPSVDLMRSCGTSLRS
jgi:hypothetical protein